MALLRLFVSSDLAHETPFWICRHNQNERDHWNLIHTPDRQSFLFPLVSYSWFDLQVQVSCSKELERPCAHAAPWPNSRFRPYIYLHESIWIAYSEVKESSGSSASSPSRRIPLVINALTLHSACTVRPKWRPWCTSGSLIHLKKYVRITVDCWRNIHSRFLSWPQLERIVALPTPKDRSGWVVFIVWHSNRIKDRAC